MRAKVTCPTDGDVIVDAAALVIDDEDSVYRFTCATCKAVIEKRMDDEIREVLRSANVATIEELVASGASALEDDRNIWRALLA